MECVPYIFNQEMFKKLLTNKFVVFIGGSGKCLSWSEISFRYRGSCSTSTWGAVRGHGSLKGGWSPEKLCRSYVQNTNMQFLT